MKVKFSRKKQNYVRELVETYGCLSEGQITYILKALEEPEESIQPFIEYITRQGLIFEDISRPGMYYAMPEEKYDENKYIALWGFLPFWAALENKNAHYACDYPATIFFLRNNNQYEVIPLATDPFERISILNVKQKQNEKIETKHNKIKYVFAYKNEDFFEKFQALLSEKTEALFVRIPEETTFYDIPKIEYIERGENRE